MWSIALVIVAFGGYFAALVALAPSGLGQAAWPFFVAIALPAAISWIAKLFVGVVDRVFDRRSLAGLPMSGADWAEEQIAALGLHGHTVSRSSSRDAYDSNLGVIMLSRNSTVERTVRAWAAAAHELGHAVMRNRWPVLGIVFRVCRVFWARFVFAGFALCAAGIMLGFEDAVGAAQIAWIISLVLAGGELIDELGASVIGCRLLGRTKALTAGQMVSSAFYLAAMLSTYVMISLVVLPFLLAPEWLAAQIGSGLVDGSTGPLSGWSIAVIFAVSLMVLAVVIEMIVNIAQRQFPTFRLVLWTGLALPFVVLLTWDQPAVLAHPWLVLLAFIPTYEILTTPIAFVASLGGRGVSRVRHALAPRSQWCHRVAPTPTLVNYPKKLAGLGSVLIHGLLRLANIGLFLPLLWFLLWG